MSDKKLHIIYFYGKEESYKRYIEIVKMISSEWQVTNNFIITDVEESILDILFSNMVKIERHIEGGVTWMCHPIIQTVKWYKALISPTVVNFITKFFGIKKESEKNFLQLVK